MRARVRDVYVFVCVCVCVYKMCVCVCNILRPIRTTNMSPKGPYIQLICPEKVLIYNEHVPKMSLYTTNMSPNVRIYRTQAQVQRGDAGG